MAAGESSTPNKKYIVAGTPPRPRFTSDNLYHIIGTKSGQLNISLWWLSKPRALCAGLFLFLAARF